MRDAASLLQRHAVAMGLFSFAVALLLLAPTVYMLQVYDRVLASGNELTLAMLSLLALGLFALLAMIEAVRSAVCVRLAALVDRLLAPKVFDGAFAAPPGTPHALIAGDLVNLRQCIAGPVPTLLFDAPLALVFLAAAFVVDPWLGAFVAASVAVLCALAFWHERRSREPLKQSQRQAAQAAQALAEAMEHAESARALGMQGALAARWLALNAQAAEQQASACVEAGRTQALIRFMRQATQSLALGLGALLVLEQRITPGMMIAATLLLGRALAPVEGLIGQGRQIAAARDAYTRLRDLMASAPAVAPIELPEPRGHLHADQLGWQAGPHQPALVQGVRINLRPGKVLGIVGPSGAGKSTLARLLAGATAPTMGQVRLDGAELPQWPEAQRAAVIGYLPQDVELFEGTVAENIARMGDVDAQQVVKAAQSASVHEMILRLPQGYQTRLGAGGITLSGGQRQRVGLARALYRNPVLLVLDEPNAHLDDQGDAALHAAVQAQRARGGSVVLVTHRMSLLQVVDEVLVLHQGRPVACGPRDDVLKETQRAIPAARQA